MMPGRAAAGRGTCRCWVSLVAFLAFGCGGETTPHAVEAVSSQPSLAAAFDGSFLVGGALGRAQITGADPVGRALAVHHFNTVTSENALKWERVHPFPDRYWFTLADRFVELGEAHDMWIVGHTLIWHKQTPRWVFRDDEGHPVSRDTLLARMRDHIHTVVGRYRGRVDGWDVVNEALAEDGSLRRSPWLEIIGEDYIAKAFEFAREADPDAALYYNDYSLVNAPKRRGAVALMRGLLDAGVPVDGIGMQGHYRMDWPILEQLDSTIAAFGELGIDVMVTELDMDVLPRAAAGDEAEIGMRAQWRQELDPYRDSLPTEVQTALARRYGQLFSVFTDHRDRLGRVTFWGVHDAASWLNDWPVAGRTSYPLLFGGDAAPKDAFWSVLDAAQPEPQQR